MSECPYGIVEASSSKKREAVFAAMRSRDPVYFSKEADSFFVTRYDDVVLALNDDRLWVATPANTIDRSEHPERFAAARASVLGWVGRGDPESHRRLQRIVQAYFTPERMTALSTLVETVVDDIVSTATDDVECDIVQRIAAPVPLRIARDMLPLPDVSLDTMKARSDAIARLFGGADEEGFSSGQDAIAAFYDDLRHAPAGGFMQYLRQQDLNGDDELLGNGVMLVFVSYETTANAIAEGALLLCERPELHAQLRKDPELVDAMVEETLRLVGPAQTVGRYAVEDLEIAGVGIAKGQDVQLVLGAANRDPAQFGQPDDLVLSREANDHLGFGRGRFFCLGAALGRLELRAVFRALTRHAARIEPQFERADIGAGPMFARRINGLPVRLAR